MAYDLTGRALYPIGDLIDLGDFPLADYVPQQSISQTFDSLYYTDASLYGDGDNLVFDLRLVWDGELSLAPPGTDAIALVLGSAGAGLTTAHAQIVLGPDYSLFLREVTVGLRVSPHVLRDRATGAAAEITFSGDLRLSSNGVSLENFVGGTLPPAYICGTEIVVEAADVRPVFGGVDPPEFLSEQPDFQGVAFDTLAVTIPSEYLELDPGSAITLAMTNAAIGSTGFTGAVAASANPGAPVTGKLLGFPFRFRELRIDIEQNALIDATLACDLRIEALEEGAQEKWLGVDVTFSADGDLSASLASVQPPEAAGTPEAVATSEYAGVAILDLVSLRITRVDAQWTCWMSGAIQLLVPGAAWPKVAFEEIGFDGDRGVHIGEGGGVTFAAPMVVDWHFARLEVSKFRFGHAQGSADRLQIALAAQIVLVEGVPSGAAVEGLVIEWTPGSGAAPDVRFEGIHIEIGVPGSFRATLTIAYRDEAGTVVFRGAGSVELPALDVVLDVSVMVGEETAGGQSFVYLYLFADAKVLPAGIPIGATGLAVYGFQGLVAYNLRLDIPAGTDGLYTLFLEPPVGITAADKWVPARGSKGLGAGIVIGTMDKGYAINVKGMLVVTLPDLTILLHARASFLKRRPAVTDSQQGALEALMVYAAGESTLTLDITANWEVSSIVSLSGSARAFFDFDDSDAWFLEIGRDEEGKRVVAQALKWNGNWLFAAGFWFRLDPHGLVTGLVVGIDLRKSRGGFYVEVKGSGRAEMALVWEPYQWEGMLELSGRISAGYRGVSIGLSLSGLARARVRRPFDVYLEVRACIEALFWDICKTFEFSWERQLEPELELPFRRAGATPRHWTAFRRPGPPEQLETGMVALEGALPRIAPHSGLAIDFAKPMLDTTGVFNEALALPDGGFLTIGEGSGYAAAYVLDAVEVFRDPDGVREPVTLWGTWARETLERNTTLRLLSSERFGDDGSLSDGYTDGHDIDYCAEPEPTERCVKLAGVVPVYGWLSDGSLYELVVDAGWAPTPDGLRLGPRDTLSIRCRSRAITTARLMTRRDDGVAETLMLVGTDGVFIVHGERVQKRLLLQICIRPGHGRHDWEATADLGGSLTGDEAWTVPAEMRIFQPGQTFELVIRTTPRLLAPDGSTSDPLGTAVATVRRFRTTGPPAYDGALTDYVRDRYPSDGQRPAYTGYDVVVRFVEAYVPFLYTSVGETLALRFFDGNGNPVLDGGGQEVLVPLPEDAPEEQSPTMYAWEQIVAANVARGCIGPVQPPGPADTVRRLRADLAPNSQYTAVLVSDARASQPLALWGFTTSRFATFTELVTRDREIAVPRIAAAPLSGADFDARARNVGLDTVAYVDRFTVTPILAPDSGACLALLMEAPEPLEAGTRLTVRVDSNPTIVDANVDGTRVLVMPQSGTFALGTLTVSMTWRRDAGPGLPVLAVDADSTAEVVVLAVHTGGAQ